MKNLERIYKSEPLLLQNDTKIQEHKVFIKQPKGDMFLNVTQQFFKTKVKRNISQHLLIAQTVCIYTSGLLIGLTNGIQGPTLVHVALLLRCTTSDMSTGIAIANVAYFMGAISTGLLFDKLPSLLTHSCTVFTIGICLITCTLFSDLHSFQVCLAILTIGLSVLTSSIPAMMMKLWDGHKLKAPLLQTYFMLASLGSFLGPFISVPFLAELPHHCRSLVTKVKLNAIHDVTNDSYHTGDGDIMRNRLSISNSIANISFNTDSFTNDLNNSMVRVGVNVTSNSCNIDVSSVSYAYMTVGVYAITSSLLCLITHLVKIKLDKTQADTLSYAQTSDTSLRKDKLSIFQKYLILLGAMIFYFCAMYYTYIPAMFLTTFAIRGLEWKVTWAAVLSSIYGGMVGLGRLVAIPLVYIISPTKHITGNFLVLTVSYIAITLYSQEDFVVWISIAGSGIGSCTMQSAIMLWIEQYMPVTSAIGGILLTSGGLGGFSGAALVGQFFDQNYMFLIYLCLIAVFIGILIFVTLNVVTRLVFGLEHTDKKVLNLTQDRHKLASRAIYASNLSLY